MSRVTAIISALLSASSSARRGLLTHYRDNANIYKAQRDKNAREPKLANARTTDMQMRQRRCRARRKTHWLELADAKAEMMLFCVMMLPLVVVGCTSKAVCQSVREATTASGVDNAASPRLADTAERDYFTLRERLITMQKQLEGNPEVY